MKRIATLLTIVFLASQSLYAIEVQQTKPIQKQQIQTKFSIDLGNISKFTSNQIKSSLASLSNAYISKMTNANNAIVVKASSNRKDTKSFKFEATVKGSKAEIEKEMSTLHEVFFDLAKSAAN